MKHRFWVQRELVDEIENVQEEGAHYALRKKVHCAARSRCDEAGWITGPDPLKIAVLPAKLVEGDGWGPRRDARASRFSAQNMCVQ